ncbi:MAG: hypothetical protein QNJ77_05910 [Acidimicrobiia bacterium]|nr:hypothetical protein [Acidimicrobiia bacterium]
MNDQDLRALERQTFRAATDDGLWDVLIAGVFAMFAVAPLLSASMGDFWSSAVFVPIWAAAFLLIRTIRARVVAPRVGTVTFGQDRMRKLKRLNIVLLVVNLLAALLGVIAALGAQLGWLNLGNGSLAYPLGLGLVVVVGFTGAAFVTGIWRYYIYGLMLAIAPLVGEWLWRNDLASHHGFPVVFGVAAGIIFVGGVVRFAVLVNGHPLPPHDLPV